jgi:hypothetical protein
MTITSNEIIPFIKLTRIKLELLKGIDYWEVFYLIKDALKTLLGISFISRIKMETKYKNDGF